jgi:lipoate synthase
MTDLRLEDYLVDCLVCGEPCIRGVCPYCEVDEHREQTRKPREYVKVDRKRFKNNPRRTLHQ